MRTLTLSIANVAMRLSCTDEAFLQELQQERYAAFVHPEGQEEMHILLQAMPVPPTRARMEGVKVRRAEGGWRFVYDTFVADVTQGVERAEVACLRSPYAVDSFLRALLGLYLPPRGGVLLHACGVCHEGIGYLFAGRSGAGKSTVARLLSSQAQVLSDELVAVRRIAEGWRVFSTPFWGEFVRASVNQSAPLKAIYVLQQASQHRLELLPLRRALSALLQCSLQFAEGAEVAEWMLHTVSALAREVPAYRLHFLPDLGFWDLVRGETAPTVK
ncbi:MAG: hypothetical protein RMM06_04445 [Armatimonadota bacterium]|nr:hypothetical protein [bacterium]MCS7309931.1 hypothetical protein [Armatimonadota bacterium]MDW8105231.1 hypothetical protein [Armatimonadota bacterium]MDW8289947.1 hypothetical protein [Armatimonadota bacterium]